MFHMINTLQLSNAVSTCGCGEQVVVRVPRDHSLAIYNNDFLWKPNYASYTNLLTATRR